MNELVVPFVVAPFFISFGSSCLTDSRALLLLPWSEPSSRYGLAVPVPVGTVSEVSHGRAGCGARHPTVQFGFLSQADASNLHDVTGQKSRLTKAASVGITDTSSQTSNLGPRASSLKPHLNHFSLNRDLARRLSAAKESSARVSAPAIVA